jgi:thioredoxin-related protein
MRILVAAFLFFTCAFNVNAQTWGHDYKDALSAAQKEHKFILVNFSGSDWCGPCIRLHKEVFVLDGFLQLANSKLILLNADFPRYKKNQLSPEQQKINDDLADRYNSRGIFPLTVLVNEKGDQIKSWEGFPSSSIDFIDEIEQATKASQN